MAYYIMGTAGHIDHGKSTFIRALTGIETDRLPEEKARGMSIDLGFAHKILPSGSIVGIIDVPGHERFLRNMLAGVSGLDVIMLVVDPNEGIKPQTIEHTDILNLLSIKGGMVVLTKADLADRKTLEMRSAELREFLAGTFLEGAPIIPLSSTTGEGINELVAHLDRLLPTIPQRDITREYRLPVDRIFSKQGFGTIVAGSLLSGTIRKGDRVMLMPAEIECKIRGLQAYNREVEQAFAGQRVAMNLSGTERREIRRGFEICPSGFLKPTSLIDGKMKVIPHSPQPLRNNAPVRAYIGTGEFLAKVKILDADEIVQDSEGFVQIHLNEPCVAMRGDRFILRNASALFTLGGGVIVDPYPSRHKRGKEEVIQILKKKESTDIDDVVLSHFFGNPQAVFSAGTLAQKLQISEETVREILENLHHHGDLHFLQSKSCYLLEADYAKMKEALLESLARLQQSEPSRVGWRKEEIEKLAGNPRKETADRILEDLALGGLLKSREGLLSPTDHVPFLTGKLEELHGKIRKELKDRGFTPDFRPDLIKKLSIDEKTFKVVEDFMVSIGELRKVAPEFLLLEESLDQARTDIARFIGAHGGINPAQARDLLKSTRKYIIPLLEYLDMSHFTRREGDNRVLA
jgi:selenocysteine-specific elongation factor